MVAFHPLPKTLDRHGTSIAACNEAGTRWTAASLTYACDHGQARLVGLLEEVRVEIDLDVELHRARERARQERRSQARKAETDLARTAAWESFMRQERRELGLRKDGQLGRLLGEPLPGEPPEALRRLAAEDRRQAEQGLVALMSNGAIFYKCVDELTERDMPARDAANRLRTTWLKERRDGWLGRGNG